MRIVSFSSCFPLRAGAHRLLIELTTDAAGEQRVTDGFVNPSAYGRLKLLVPDAGQQSLGSLVVMLNSVHRWHR